MLRSIRRRRISPKLDDALTAESCSDTSWTMDDYKQHLRRLAVHDEALLDGSGARPGPFVSSTLDQRTAALVRVAAAIGADAPASSLFHAISHALSSGVTNEEIVATLALLSPIVGTAQVVRCTPHVALALGYDVEAALERRDP